MSVTDSAIIPAAEHLERVAIEVGRIAAEYVNESRGTTRAVATKSTPTDVVTETDLASESLIRRELFARCPGSSVLGEEYEETDGGNEIRWIVDPIDGTVNFLYGLPVVSVSIAAEVGGEIAAGAVVDMLSGETYSARRGAGARCEGRPLAVSTPESIETSLVGTGFSYEPEVRAEQAAVLTRLLPICRDIRCMGSAALNLCWVAAGLLDAYFERNIQLYDYAAGGLIAAEAGATVELPPTPAAGLTLAAAPRIADRLREIITGH